MKNTRKRQSSSKPKKAPASRSLEQLEEERRGRRLDALKGKFSATLKHISEVERVNEEYYQARKDLSESGMGNSHHDKARKKDR